MAGEPASLSRNDAVSYRVLIVEDNPFIALDFEMQIEGMGHTVVGIAATEAAAISTARAHRPDIAIVDLHLADGSRGQDAAATLRTDLDIPSVIVSGSLHLLTEEERAAIRPVAMLSKPLLPDELRRAIDRAG